MILKCLLESIRRKTLTHVSCGNTSSRGCESVVENDRNHGIIVCMNTYTFRTIIEPDGKQFHGYVPALRGCHTFGKTITETQKHLREAIQVHVESLIAEGEDVPFDAGIESFETVMLSNSKVVKMAYA